MKHLLCALLFAPLVASADEIIVHVGSYHQDNTYYHDGSHETYNNFNPGVGYPPIGDVAGLVHLALTIKTKGF